MSEVIEQVQGQEPAANAGPSAVNPENPSNPRDAFISMLPEDLRGEGVFANHQSVADLAKSYVSAAKMVGLDKNALLPIPRDDSKEAWDAVYNKLGRPETPDAYNLDPYKDAADGNVLKDWAGKLHNLGLNQKQVDGVLGDFFGQSKAAQEAMKVAQDQRFSAWNDEITKELGLAKDRKLDAAVNLVEKNMGEGALDFIAEHPEVFKDPRMVKFLVGMADKTGESSVLLADGKTTNGALSPADAQQQLSALKSNPEYMKAMLDKGHPQHEYFVNQQNKLFEFAFPG